MLASKLLFGARSSDQRRKRWEQSESPPQCLRIGSMRAQIQDESKPLTVLHALVHPALEEGGTLLVQRPQKSDLGRSDHHRTGNVSALDVLK